MTADWFWVALNKKKRFSETSELKQHIEPFKQVSQSALYSLICSSNYFNWKEYYAIISDMFFIGFSASQNLLS